MATEQRTCEHAKKIFGMSVGVKTQSTNIVPAAMAEAAGRPDLADVSACERCQKEVASVLAVKAKSVPIFSVPILEGRPILSYFGIVTGHSVVGAGAMTEFTSGADDFFGTESTGFAGKIATAEASSLKTLRERAVALGANAVIGVDIDYGQMAGTMIMVTATGTAVRLAD